MVISAILAVTMLASLAAEKRDGAADEPEVGSGG